MKIFLGNNFVANTCGTCIRTRANTGKYSWRIIYVLVSCQGVFLLVVGDFSAKFWQIKLGGRFGYFLFYFFCLGRGEGESEAPGGGGGSALFYLLQIPGGGGVSRSGSQGAGRVSATKWGILAGGGGRQNIFFRGRNVHQEKYFTGCWAICRPILGYCLAIYQGVQISVLSNALPPTTHLILKSQTFCSLPTQRMSLPSI